MRRNEKKCFSKKLQVLGIYFVSSKNFFLPSKLSSQETSVVFSLLVVESSFLFKRGLVVRFFTSYEKAHQRFFKSNSENVDDWFGEYCKKSGSVRRVKRVKLFLRGKSSKMTEIIAFLKKIFSQQSHTCMNEPEV